MKSRKLYSYKPLRDYNAYESNRRWYVAFAIIALIVGGVLFCLAVTGVSDNQKTIAETSVSQPQEQGGKNSHSTETKPQEQSYESAPESSPSEPVAPTTPPSAPQSQPESSPTDIAMPGGLSQYRVDKVIDGDTIRVFVGGQSTKVRLIGIDTPETVHPRKPVECYGPEASNYAKQLMTGETVALEFDSSQGTTDYYGRLLAYVYVDGIQVNYRMVRQGYGNEYTYDTNYRYRDEFIAAENMAQQESIGLWSAYTCAGGR